jgi:AcrR family transcriptional regulator
MSIRGLQSHKKSSRAKAAPKSAREAPAEDLNGGRRQVILTEAARLFATRGFSATTIRDIADAAGILGGSIYYHFTSKEEIFLAVHSMAIETMSSAVRAATNGITDPWGRLEATAIAHCESLLSTNVLRVLVSPHFPHEVGDLSIKLTAQRDAYEKMIIDIVADLDLPPAIDRQAFRLHFLGALNWAATWYRAGGRLAPDKIARQLISMLHHPPRRRARRSRRGFGNN